MYYDLLNFGLKVKEVRKSLLLSQNDVSEKTGISADTLYRIENGHFYPKHANLELLSCALRLDLNKLFLEFRVERYGYLQEIEQNISKKCELADYSGLIIESDSLKELLSSSTMTHYYNTRCKQLLFLIESIILKSLHKNVNLALNKLTNALKLSNQNFKLAKYKMYRYNNLELYLLMSTALLLRHTDSTEKSYDVLKFCYNYFENNAFSSDFFLYEKLCYNLSYACHRLKLYDEALVYSSIGVDYCNKQRLYNMIGLLYARKGIAEHLLNSHSSTDSLRRAKHFLKLTNHDKNLHKLIVACKKHYNIDLLNI